MTRLVSLLVLIVALLVAVPAAASAATWCVSPATGCDHPEPDVQTALDDAANNPGPDTVMVGAGTATTNGYTYAGDASNPVVIDGAGEAATTLATASPGQNLLIASGGGSVTVENLTAAVNGASSNNNPVYAFILDGPADVISNVRVTSGTTSNRVSAVQKSSAGGLTISHSTFALDINNSSQGVSVSGGNVTVADSAITSAAYGLLVNGANVHVTRSSITSRYDPVEAYSTSTSPNSLLIDDSQLISPSDQQYGTTLLTNESTNAGQPASAVLRHDTLIGSGTAKGGHGIINSGFGGDAPVTVDSTVFSGIYITATAQQGSGGSATIGLDYSDFDPTSFQTTTGSEVTEGSHNLDNVDPQFAGSSDYHLQSTSPLIGAGNPALDPAESTTDFDGHPRVVDPAGSCNGISDIGAYEFQHFQSHAVAAASTATSPTGQLVTFDASKSCDSATGDQLTYAWSFDDGAAATGAVVQHAFSTPGQHTATITVTDSGGSTSTAAVTVSVTAPQSGGGAGATPPPSSIPFLASFAGASAGGTRTFTVSKNGTFVWSFACPAATVGGCAEQLGFTMPQTSLKLIMAKRSKKPKTATIATSSFHLNAAQTKRVTIKLSKQALAALRKHHKLRTTVTIRSKDGAGHTKTATVTVTLKLGR